MREAGDWGEFNLLSPMQKYAIWLRQSRARAYGWVFAWLGVVFDDLGFGDGGMQYSHFIFRLEGVYVPVVGPHLGVKPKGKKASQ